MSLFFYFYDKIIIGGNMEAEFYFEDFDVTNQTLDALNSLALKISQKEQISLENAIDKLITSNIFKKFMNPRSMMWAKNVDDAYLEYKNQLFPTYIFDDKDITEEIDEKIIHICNVLSKNNNISKIKAACVLMNN